MSEVFSSQPTPEQLTVARQRNKGVGCGLGSCRSHAEGECPKPVENQCLRCFRGTLVRLASQTGGLSEAVRAEAQLRLVDIPTA